MDLTMRRAIENECARLVIAFFDHLDRLEYEHCVAMFVPDGIFVRGGREHKGHAGIMELQRSRRSDRMTRHLVTNILVEVLDADLAEGHFYCTIYSHIGALAEGDPAPLGDPEFIVLFHDRYRRTDAGWRFAYRRIERLFARR